MKLFGLRAGDERFDQFPPAPILQDALGLRSAASLGTPMKFSYVRRCLRKKSEGCLILTFFALTCS